MTHEQHPTAKDLLDAADLADLNLQPGIAYGNRIAAALAAKDERDNASVARAARLSEPSDFVTAYTEPDYGPETPGYIGIDTFGHSIYEPEPDLPDWAQDLADKGECAVIVPVPFGTEKWCVTHGVAMTKGHAMVQPGQNLD